MHPKILEARNLMSNGQVQEALNLLDRFQRKHKIDGEDRLMLAKLYKGLAMNDKSIKALGPIIQPNIGDELSQSEIDLAITQARMIAFAGCKYLAAKLYKQLIEYLVVSKKAYTGEDVIFLFHFYAHNLLDRFEIPEARKTAELFKLKFNTALKEKKVNDRGLFFLHELFVRLTLNEGNYASSHEHLNLLDGVLSENEKHWKAISLNRRAQAYLYQLDYKNAWKTLQLTGTLIQENPGAFPAEEIYWYQLMAQYWIELGDKETAFTFLQTLLKRSKNYKLGPNLIVTGLLHLEKIAPDFLNIGEKIAIRNHPNCVLVTYLAGRALGDKSTSDLPPWTLKKLPAYSDNNCWQVVGQEILPKDYAREREFIISTIQNKNKSILDLVSGVFATESGIILLSDIQHRALLAMAGSGQLGIDKWSLMEFVYRQSFVNIQSGLDRVAKIIQSLRKLGFAISLEENQYTVEISSFKNIFLPMIWHNIGLWNLAKTANGAVDLVLLKKTLGVKNTTAQNWVNNWRELGKVA
jgi:hypothetical protein